MSAVEDQLRPTYAAVLLFGMHPQRWVPSASILAARFSGTTFGDRFVKQELSATLPAQLRQAEGFVRDNLRREVRMLGLNSEQVLEYPAEAVRELLVNAVAHRDYNLQGDTIHLNIFADRLVVSSPGGLPGPVTLENLLEARSLATPSSSRSYPIWVLSNAWATAWIGWLPSCGIMGCLSRVLRRSAERSGSRYTMHPRRWRVPWTSPGTATRD